MLGKKLLCEHVPSENVLDENELSESVLGESELSESVLGESVLSESVQGESVLGDLILGEMLPSTQAPSWIRKIMVSRGFQVRKGVKPPWNENQNQDPSLDTFLYTPLLHMNSNIHEKLWRWHEVIDHGIYVSKH